MKLPIRHRYCAVFAALCLAAATQAQSNSELVVRANGTAPVITFTREHGMVKGVDDTPMLRLYADGLVAIQIPAYMKGAGFYELQLQRPEFDALLREFDAAGLMRFDPKAAQGRKAAAAASHRASSGERFITMDSTTTRIELEFSSYGSASGALSRIDRTIEWADLAIDAERYAQLDELVALAAVEKRLLGLANDARRRAVKTPTRQ